MDPEKLMQEALEISGMNGFQNGRRDVFERMHLMLVSLGYDTGGEMFVKMRQIARTCGTPIGEDGVPEEVVIGRCERCDEVTTVYETDAPRCRILCGACDNTPSAHRVDGE